MTVLIEGFNAQGGGGPQSAYFADSFDRVDQPFNAGTFWAYSPLAENAASYTTSYVDTNTNVAGSPGKLIITNPAGAYAFFPYIPLQLNVAALWGLKQFAELKIDSMPNFAGDDAVGASVMYVPNRGDMYHFGVYNGLAGTCTCNLDKYINGAFVAHLLGPLAFTYGHTARVEVTISGGVNTLTIYDNSVQIGQTTDAAITGGMPNIFAVIKGGGGHSATVSNFKCGSLPQISTNANFP